MKKIALLMLIMFMSLQVFSQKKTQLPKKQASEYSYKVSTPYRVEDASSKYYFAKNNEAMSVKIDGADVTIQKFDSEKPAFIKSKKFENLFPKNFWAEDILQIDGKFYFFYSSWDGGDVKNEQLFATEIDFDKGEFVGTPRLIIKISGKIAMSSVRMTGFMSAVGTKFEFMQSSDKKNLLVKYRRIPEVKRDVKSYDIIGLTAFDQDLNKLSGNEVTMPYTERRMNNLDYQLDKKGNLFMLTKVFHDDSNEDKKHKKDKVANYHIELLTIKAGTSKVETSKFDNNDKFVNKIWMFDTSKDYLVCGGFYSKAGGEIDDSDGIMAFKINQEGKIYDNVYHEIPVEVINQYESEKTKKKNEKKERKEGDGAQFSDLELKTLYVNEDGSIVLIGEQYFEITKVSNSMNGTKMKTSYHYYDILATKINANGELAWMKKIPKKQVGSSGKGGMSYKHFFTNHHHYLVFLDNVKNLNLPLDKEPAQHTDGQGGYLTAVKISDADGISTKGSILNAREVASFKLHQFSTDRVFKTSEDTFMLEAYKKGKEDVMIKVSLK